MNIPRSQAQEEKISLSPVKGAFVVNEWHSFMCLPHLVFEGGVATS